MCEQEWKGNSPTVKMKSFADQQECLFSREKCLTSTGYILVRRIPVQVELSCTDEVHRALEEILTRRARQNLSHSSF